MPHDSSTAGQKAKSSRRRSKSDKTNDSTKTHRGSPVPQPPDVSDTSGSSTGTHIDHYNPDQDLLGFGAQFDTK
ncbi:hypothetical protein F5Y13DRAFT_189924 [Hypoxylon sp. FL1857]|nr:hypothetical protein F5Y13DRAFT_189924 [Hypoxylon sp. FL1857]